MLAFLIDHSLGFYLTIAIGTILLGDVIVPLALQKLQATGQSAGNVWKCVAIHAFIFGIAGLILLGSFEVILDWTVLHPKAENADNDETASETEPLPQDIEENQKTPEEMQIEAFICLSKIREIGINELECLSNTGLFLVRNGIYAYCGRIFSEEYLSEFFSQYEWYYPCFEDDDSFWERFNDSQKATIMNIKELESRRREQEDEGA